MDDLISRQAAIDALSKHAESVKEAIVEEDHLFVDVLTDGMERAVRNIPSAQPDLPEWAKKVEQMRGHAEQMPYIHNPLAWALYQVWKEYDK